MIEVHEETTSTNDLALEAAREGAPHGACWLADRQTEGRGRREVGGQRRRWFSPPGSNLHMSVLLRPDLEPDLASGLTLAAAVGVADAIIEQTDVDLWIKWPNDLYVGDRKLGGILTEAEIEDGALEAVVVGLGLNVNLSADRLPDQLVEYVTSLQIEGERPWDRLELALAVQAEWIERCEAFADEGVGAVLEALRGYDRSPGRTVTIDCEDEKRQGVARGIGEDGRLVVESDGETHRVGAGEVTFDGLAQPPTLTESD